MTPKTNEYKKRKEMNSLMQLISEQLHRIENLAWLTIADQPENLFFLLIRPKLRNIRHSDQLEVIPPD